LLVDSADEVYKNGDPYLDEDQENPYWIWDIANMAASGTSEI